MNFKLRTELPQLLLIAAMFALAAWSWQRLPEQIPTHWNLQGEVDGQGSKLVGLLLLPLTVVGIYVAMLLMPFVDPGRANYQNFTTTYNVMRLLIVAFLAAVYLATLAAAFGFAVNVKQVSFLGAGVMCMFIGNYLGKIRPNWFVGVRTPWTLSSRKSWNKTHRLASWLFMLIGVLFAVGAFLQNVWMLTTLLVVSGACVVLIIAYSYVVYLSDPHRNSPADTQPSAD
jgi:uncharacterized membrane protein